jgi:hypothetical protein
MTNLNQFISYIQTFDPALLGIGIITVLLLILLFRRPNDRTGAFQEALTAKEVELRDAQNVDCH